ncbi:MAG: YitT family protein [Spiroplasma sp.]|nr:YitT family protein [Spiroplasma sp.]
MEKNDDKNKSSQQDNIGQEVKNLKEEKQKSKKDLAREEKIKKQQLKKAQKEKKKREKRARQKRKSLFLDAFNFKDTKIKEEFHSSWKNFNITNTAKNLWWVLIGAFLTSISFYYFINPANLYTNGLSAFAQLIAKVIFFQYEKTDPELYEQMRALYYYPILFAMNIPIIIWGLFKVGWRFSFYTVIYMGLNIGLLTGLSLIPYVKDFKVFGAVLNENEVLSQSFIFAVLGGLINGTGLGLLFKTGGSSGGMDFISTYISIKRKYSVANIIKNTNIVIVIIAVFLDGTILHKRSVPDNYFSDPYFFATIFYIYVTSLVMNRVYPKFMMMTVFIISTEIEEIRKYIYANNYLRGGNIWNVKGLYSGKEYNMMMTTMSLLEYNFFKYKIANIDPKLFMIAVPTRNMHGGNQGNPPSDKPVDVKKITDVTV